ncbi:unnamed protein product [Owenia fusiformis]|uniref:Translation initiation factor eIF2B subunit alpha n=1 Tax=Owenia fusiformis TaxID=6347 RepID=A0A8J1UY71_OWEFU|nr:unnamed protein product [Owenia fusiformis]
MNDEDIVRYFVQTVREDGNMSEAVAAIQTLVEYMKLNTAETLSGLRDNLKHAIEIVSNTEVRQTAILSGCELFLRFITLASLDSPDFQECRQVLIERGNMFLKKCRFCRRKIAKLGLPFIRDGATILTHSYSRVVLQLLKDAMEANRRFRVFVTQSAPDNAGNRLHDELTKLGVPSTLILDSAVGYVMEKVDMVLVGAEAVVESGGIINKIGTYTMAISAREMHKPVYVLAESFKFARIYPLNQQDVPDQFKYPSNVLTGQVDLNSEHPLVDYTPPAYLSLLVTDLGVLTPSAVSDELIKLYC